MLNIFVNFVIVEIEVYRFEFIKIRVELESWEKDLIVYKGKLDVVLFESEFLSNKVLFSNNICLE